MSTHKGKDKGKGKDKEKSKKKYKDQEKNILQAAKGKVTQSKFRYKNDENVDVLSNYLTLLNRGLKNRQLSLGGDGETIELLLPESVEFKVKADTKSDKASLSLELEWTVPKPEKAKKLKIAPNTLAQILSFGHVTFSMA